MTTPKIVVPVPAAQVNPVVSTQIESTDPYYMTPTGPVYTTKLNPTALPVARVLAWKPDIPDHRDFLYSPTLTAKAKARVAFVTPIGLNNRIEDQGQLGSCTGNASTSALEIVTKSPNQLSRLMAYYGGRALEGTVKTDAGAYVRDVIKGLSKSGVCNEALWPYNINKFAVTPPAAAYRDALKVIPKVASYQRVTTLNDVKNAIASGLPVVFGFMVPQYFMSQAVATTGWVRLPTSSDWMIGGHCVAAVGYDERGASPFVWVRNSWGAGWGRQGYFKMDQAWFTDPRRLVDDMWVIIPKV
jgi:C1A family cysteine protease